MRAKSERSDYQLGSNPLLFEFRVAEIQAWSTRFEILRSEFQ
jgi:hypothetical protein